MKELDKRLSDIIFRYTDSGIEQQIANLEQRILQYQNSINDTVNDIVNLGNLFKVSI